MSEREWRFYVDDMISFAEKVLAYSDGLDQEGFVASGLTYDATLRNLELLGEAATHIPAQIRDANPAIPWRQLIATRNRLIHGYLGIDAVFCLPRQAGSLFLLDHQENPESRHGPLRVGER